MDSTSYLITKVLGIAAVDVVKAGLAEDHAQVARYWYALLIVSIAKLGLQMSLQCMVFMHL